MFINDIVIDPYVADKIRSKHHVSEQEVYEIFENDEETVWIRRSHKVGGRYVAYGQTLGGRYLFVPFELDEENTAHIVSAREMDEAERRLYRRSL